MRFVFAGFLAGALAALGVAVVLRPRLAAPAERGTEGAAETSGVAPSGPDPQNLDGLRARIASLRKENERLAAKLAAAPAGPEGGGARKSRSAREMGPDFMEAWGSGQTRGPAAARCRLDFSVLTGELAEKYGITAEEAKLAPEAILAAIRGMRESLGAPDEVEKEKIDGIIGRYEQSWQEFLARRGDEMAMDRLREAFEMNLRAREELHASFPADVSAKVKAGAGALQFSSWDLSSGYVETSRATAEQDLAGRWVTDLGLDPSAIVSLRPLAADYLRAADEGEKLAVAQGESPDWQAFNDAETLKALERMAMVQRRIGELAHLSPEQAKRLSEWVMMYDVQYEGDETNVILAPEEK